MDENSREGESSKNLDKPTQSETPKQTDNVSSFFQNVPLALCFDSPENTQDIAPRVGFDTSGPSTFALPTSVSGEQEVPGTFQDEDEEEQVPCCLFEPRKSGYDIIREYRPLEHTDISEGLQQRSIGPPPSYSFVMKQKKKFAKFPAPEPSITDRVPPPTYTGTRGIFLPTEDPRICNIPSFPEPIWRSHSQPALCPRCGILILTSTHSHDSVATHVAALALCLFGCWPCCLIPYCLNVCKNTFHHCPICQTYLGAYTPW